MEVGGYIIVLEAKASSLRVETALMEASILTVVKVEALMVKNKVIGSYQHSTGATKLST